MSLIDRNGQAAEFEKFIDEYFANEPEHDDKEET